MTLKIEKILMNFQGNVAKKEIFDDNERKFNEKALKKLVQNAVKDYQHLVKDYRLYPVMVHNLSDLVGKELITEKNFMRWLVKRKNAYLQDGCQWEINCIPREKDKNPITVDFGETMYVNFWYKGCNKSKKAKLYSLINDSPYPGWR